ncbi:MAG: beta-propeller domain-containing protein [bacterium]|nr:beta-propeller domain-containing protein [bacterium]
MINFKKEVGSKLSFLVLSTVFLLALGFIWMDSQGLLPQLSIYFPKLPRIVLPRIPGQQMSLKDIKKFVSEEDFRSYLQLASEASTSFDNMVALKEAMPMAVPGGLGSGAAERVSETTVQVTGIDEPDIVKTDGKEIYFSQERSWWPMMENLGRPFLEDEMYPPEFRSTTKVIKAFPPADLKLDAEIEKNGNLLLTKNTLVVFSNQEIVGYDVSDPKKPKEKWSLKLDNNVWLVASRLKDGKIYLVTQTNINQNSPCPIEILKAGETPLSIRCQDIYHPVDPVPVDTTFTAMILDPSSGKIEENVSFVGSTGSSVVYMSGNAIFATYSYFEDTTRFFLSFLKEKAKDLFPSWVAEKLEKLSGYDLSQQTKMMELQMILEKFQSSLKDDERLKFENELTNRLGDYLKENMRDLEKTGIVKISLSDFKVAAVGSIPGHPLNQFSLDEYQGNLRIAVTIGQRWWGWGFGSGGNEMANDVYVLDKDLKITGSVKNLGLTERIYSARFVEDRGYLVTFRETDPFYVLDLADPRNPAMKGELKIPGYSSYLQPISKDKVLGIGKEGSQVKVSLFDVSSASNPREVAKYTLDEYWSDVLSTHHAFLLDTKHEVFFLPGSQGGYIFSYKGDNLEMKKAVSNISAKRAIYLDDYLYIIGEDKIVVLNELDWARIGELSF